MRQKDRAPRSPRPAMPQCSLAIVGSQPHPCSGPAMRRRLPKNLPAGCEVSSPKLTIIQVSDTAADARAGGLNLNGPPHLPESTQSGNLRGLILVLVAAVLPGFRDFGGQRSCPSESQDF